MYKEVTVEKIYLFNAEKAAFASAVFTSKQLAESWIQKHHVCGVLTEYPVNTSCYDWAIEHGYFVTKSPIDCSPVFIGKFLSAYQQKWRYKHGDLLGNCYMAIPSLVCKSDLS